MNPSQSKRQHSHTIAYVVVGIALVTTLTGTLVAYSGTDKGDTVPCAQEDSPGPCYWDASTMGNGVGLSYTVDAAQVVHYS